MSRLAAWAALVAAQILLAYGSRASSGKPPKDVVYHYSLAVGGLVEYGIVIAVVLWIARGRVRELLALRGPSSLRVAVGASVGLLVGIYVLSAILSSVLDPGREQGLTPSGWQPGHVGAFLASFLVIVFVAPIVEEATFRGLGYSLLEPYGRAVAVVLVGLTFGLAHGLVEALPLLAAFGAGLAIVRAWTGSLYPCIAVHAAFNAIALTVSVTT